MNITIFICLLLVTNSVKLFLVIENFLLSAEYNSNGHFSNKDPFPSFSAIPTVPLGSNFLNHEYALRKKKIIQYNTLPSPSTVLFVPLADYRTLSEFHSAQLKTFESPPPLNPYHEVLNFSLQLRKGYPKANAFWYNQTL